MAACITLAGESLKAQKQGAHEALEITHFVLALVPDLDPNSPIDRSAGLPPAEQIVGTWAYTQKGFVDPNRVVYSLMLGSDIGDFDWNWIGLVTAEGTLFAVSTVPVQQKRRNIPPLQVGNNVTRNFMVAFDGAQELTGITVEANTWQHDFTEALRTKQPLHANLSALSDLTGAADRLPYFTGAGALSLTALTAAARTLLAAPTQAAQRSAMNLFTDASGVVTEGSGALSNIVSLLLQSATAAAARATLGADDASNLTKGTIPAERVPTLNQNTSGNAATASKLQAARKINGVKFDGTQDITITASSTNAIGEGQTWQNVTAQRAVNTTYTNTTGRTIAAYIRSGKITSGSSATVTVGSHTFDLRGDPESGGAYLACTILIPSGETYRSSTNGKWLELR